jgi:hypothetical protein
MRRGRLVRPRASGRAGAVARGVVFAGGDFLGVAMTGAEGGAVEMRSIFGGRPRRDLAEVSGDAAGLDVTGTAAGAAAGATGPTGVFTAGMGAGAAGWVPGALLAGTVEGFGAVGAGVFLPGMAAEDFATGAATFAGGTGTLAGADHVAAACLSFSTDLDATMEGAKATGLAGVEDLGFGAGDFTARVTGAFAADVFFATGRAEATFALDAGAAWAGAEIFLADFLREGFLAIRAESYHVG